MKEFFKDIFEFVLNTLFPIYCLGCTIEQRSYFCEPCQNKLLLNPAQQCIVCHLPSIQGLTHPKCITRFKPEGLLSIFDYSDKVISEAIILGKYKFVPDIYQELSEIAATYISLNYQNIFKQADYICFVPLNSGRQRWRGFNQAEIIGKVFSETFHLPIIKALVRNRNTKTQKDLGKDQRQNNMKNAFSFNNVDIKNKNLILVDDVMTTGATLLEAVKVLKNNGANNIYCVTLARD
jgi:competence protein ComFC